MRIHWRQIECGNIGMGQAVKDLRQLTQPIF